MSDDNEVALEYEKELTILISPEDLEAVDLGLAGADELQLQAKERYRLAIDASLLKWRLKTAKATMLANQNVGNESAKKQWMEQIEDITRQYMHTLRGIKNLDDDTRGAAKKEMQRLAERQRGLPDMCPQCGKVLK